MTRDLITWIWLAFPLGLGLGYVIGGRHADGYWADHGEHGGSVHHRGKFYKVTPEGLPPPPRDLSQGGQP